METRAADIGSLQETAGGGFRDARGEGGIVFDPARLRQADWRVFEPAQYAQAEPVGGEGGRGSAWFVVGEAGPAVLKQYRRGGWTRRLVSDRYLWLGRQRVRSLREFALLRKLHEAGLPVPAPIAAGWRRAGLAYRASLLTQRLAGVDSFVSSVRTRRAAAPWAAVGAIIARFHRCGLRHADLNAHNLLVDGEDDVFLIDWDKAREEAGPGAWCEGVLARLERSLRKQLPELEACVIGEGMQRLRAAHAAGLRATSAAGETR
jgi:3-deoxy-D-manno-octulosonic acid kinase